MTFRWSGVLLGAALLVAGCGSSKEAAAPPTPAAAPATAEGLTRDARRLHAAGEVDSAAAALASALSLDSAYRPALEQKGLLFYDVAMRAQARTRRQTEAARAAREAYFRLERLGGHEADIYERICDLSVVLGDNATHLRYARKSAELFPYDRQYYNLSLALMKAGEYNEAITVLKQCLARFPASAFIGGFHRQLGKAYASVDRDQTAEKTFAAGVRAADARLAALGNDESAAADRQRLIDDKIAMLLALKKLHQTYGRNDLLREVERQLKEAGYER